MSKLKKNIVCIFIGILLLGLGFSGGYLLQSRNVKQGTEIARELNNYIGQLNRNNSGRIQLDVERAKYYAKISEYNKQLEANRQERSEYINQLEKNRRKRSAYINKLESDIIEFTEQSKQDREIKQRLIDDLAKSRDNLKRAAEILAREAIQEGYYVDGWGNNSDK